MLQSKKILCRIVTGGEALGLTLGLADGHRITRQLACDCCVPRHERVLPRDRYLIPGSQLLEHDPLSRDCGALSDNEHPRRTAIHCNQVFRGTATGHALHWFQHALPQPGLQPCHGIAKQYVRMNIQSMAVQRYAFNRQKSSAES